MTITFKLIELHHLKGGLSYTRVGFIGKSPFRRPSTKPSFSAQYRHAKQVSHALITHFYTNSYSNLLPPSLYFGKMGKGSKRGKIYTKASGKAAALPVLKGANSTHMTKGRLTTERQACNYQCQEVMEVTTPTKPPPLARESILDADRLAA
jgi:hypothetical protein